MRIFISQPMNGLDDDEILSRRHEIEERCRKVWPDCEFVDSYIEEDPPEDVKQPGAWFLGESIKRLATADAIFLAYGYREARGCVRERDAAVAYGMQCIYEQNNGTMRVTKDRETTEYYGADGERMEVG